MEGSSVSNSNRVQSEALAPSMSVCTSVRTVPPTWSPPAALSPTRSKAEALNEPYAPGAAKSSSSAPPPRSK
ncbi:MAG: hypothetical protein BWX88_04890 [Planctomycetes bacterium ADurb.Bin126]|nr:MAG: hypothetical protein BWX88_04890 [Planctomycetes bacterium ADurb.Bin126]